MSETKLNDVELKVIGAIITILAIALGYWATTWTTHTLAWFAAALALLCFLRGR